MINNSLLTVLAMGLHLGVLAGCQPAPDLPKGYQGVIEFDEFRVGFEFPGRVELLKVDVGNQLKVGDLIATLDDSLDRAQIQIRQREVEAAEQRTLLVKARSRPEEIAAMRARIRAAAALEAQLRHNLDREQVLVASGAAPRAGAEDISSQLERAEAQRQELEQSLGILQRGARKEEIAQAEALTQASQAAAEALNARLLHYQLLSPVAGEVLKVYAKQGETVAIGATVVGVADPAHPYAEVFVPQADVPKLSVGKALSIRVDGIAEALPAKVEWIARETEFTPHYLFSEQERHNLMLRVRVRIEDPQRQLRAGVPAFVSEAETKLAAGHHGDH